MTSSNRGQRRLVDRARRTAVDISIVARRVPSFPLVSRVDLAQVERWRQSRKVQGSRIGWGAILSHAYGSVSRSIPELRDVYVARPLPYVYRHPDPVVTLAIHRKDSEGQERLIWARITSPESLSLEELQARIDYFSTAPIDEVFRDGLRLERRVSVVRRLNWYLLMRWCGRKRAKHLGTFSISSLGHLGVFNLHHPIVTASSLAMGPLGEGGQCNISLICDHRVLDGVLAARALGMLVENIRALAK